MNIVESFFSKAEEDEIVEAIRTAEKNTSGEIRVHLEKNEQKPPMERAREVFYSLGMDKTKAKNAVLFYINVQKKQFAILGDQGIDEVVPDNFWQDAIHLLTAYFKREAYKEGLVKAILEVGLKLKEYFPHQSDDTNELDDAISKQ